MKQALNLSGLILGALLALSGCSSIMTATTDKPITPDPSERTVGTVLDDNRLETIAKVNINKAHAGLANAHVNVDAHNGIVLLTGQVPNTMLRDLATETVRQLPKAREVFNELQITNNTSLITRSNDSWLCTKVKAQLMSNKSINSGNIQVICEDSAIYLMGMLTRDQATRAADSVRLVAGVKKVVKAVEYLD